MILTRLVRAQLAIFAILSVASISFVTVVYGELPRRLGIGNLRLSADFDDVSGLYADAIVTYRGRTIGQVTRLELVPDAVRVHMDLTDDYRIPADVQVEVHSTSAIGEQYVDLVPKNGQGPYLEDGAVLPADRTIGMPQITPVLDRLNDLLASLPPGATRRALRGTATSFAGAGPAVGELADATGELVDSATARLDETRDLIRASAPVLATQVALAQSTRFYAASLASFTVELAKGDPALRHLLNRGAALEDIRALLEGIQPTLPALLANLRITASAVDTYAGNLEQTLVLYPALVSALQTAISPRIGHGDVKLDLKAMFNGPRSCIAGYVPPESRRSPSDLSRREDGARYCQLPPTAPEGVRGARNVPCPNSDRRAPSSAACGLRFPPAVIAPTPAGERYGDLVSLLDGPFLDNINALLQGGMTSVRKGETWKKLLLLPLRAGQPAR